MITPSVRLFLIPGALAVMLWTALVATAPAAERPPKQQSPEQQSQERQRQQPQPTFESLDKNSDGKVGINEATDDDALFVAFEDLDRNRDGELTREEFARFKGAAQPAHERSYDR